MVNGLGLFGIHATRFSDATTSSGPNVLPSWKCTPGRSLNSQVVSSMGFHSVASPGFSRWCSSWSINRSKRLSEKLMLDERLWNSGSIEVTAEP